jgi:hypothetical protein
VFAKANGIDYNLAYIPGDFIYTSTQAFDPVYMGKLYDLGFRMAEAGYPWKKVPPRMAGHRPTKSRKDRGRAWALSLGLGWPTQGNGRSAGMEWNDESR